jgi:hypothetical protein
MSSFDRAIHVIMLYSLHVQRGNWRKYTPEEIETSNRLFERVLWTWRRRVERVEARSATVT